MLVYGIRCDPSELLSLPKEVTADYYVEHKLLVFPSYTRPTVLNANGSITQKFMDELKAVVRGRAWVMEREHPYITEEEYAVVTALRASNPLITTEWFYMPTD
jgi:hypothetical protein